MLVKGVPDRKWAPATDLPLSAIFCLMAETIWHIYMTIHQYRADSKLAPSQWEMSLQINTVSHWLGANPRISTHSNSTHAVSVVFGTQVTVELACMLPISMAPILRQGICNNHGENSDRYRSSSQLLSFQVMYQFLCTCSHPSTVKPVCNDHLYFKIYYLWLI